MRVIVTGGAIIRDHLGRILLQRRSDYGDWGLPGGAMEPGETIEETMKREVLEETGLVVTDYELYSIYSGPRLQYQYPDGNKVVFVMFVFHASTDLHDKVKADGMTLIHKDKANESLSLEFKNINYIELSNVSTVQRPLIEDLKNNRREDILRA